MPRSLSLRYLLFKTLLIPKVCVFSPRAESATFLFAAMVACRPRNPRFKDVHTGTKRRLGDKKSNRDSGISGSGCILPCARYSQNAWFTKHVVVCFTCHFIADHILKWFKFPNQSVERNVDRITLAYQRRSSRYDGISDGRSDAMDAWSVVSRTIG